MKRALSILLCAAALAGRGVAASDEEVETRKLALDVSTAFSNDGFKARDGNWSGSLKPNGSLLLQVHLYAGNQYWFIVAGNEKRAKKLSVTVFDENGRPLSGDEYQEGPKAAMGVAPEASGPYYIRIRELEGEPTNFTLIYSYK